MGVGHSWCPQPDERDEVTGQEPNGPAVHLPPLKLTPGTRELLLSGNKATK